jgi:molybdopterin synthase catalytic subunit
MAAPAPLPDRVSGMFGAQGPRTTLAAVVPLAPPADGDDWLGLTDAVLPAGVAADWAVRPSCGAVVLFSGTSRDHSPGRIGVTTLEYEAYEEQVVPRLAAIAEAARARWPELGRLVLLHRVGEVPVGESSVVVVASAPHRDAAFAAARYGIDTLKATVPIWKREVWEGGADWTLDATPVEDVAAGPRPGPAPEAAR